MKRHEHMDEIEITVGRINDGDAAVEEAEQLIRDGYDAPGADLSPTLWLCRLRFALRVSRRGR